MKTIAREIGGLLHFIGAHAAFYGGILLLAWARDQLANYFCPF